MTTERPLTTTEAAAGLGVSRATVKHWIQEFSVGAAQDPRGDWSIAADALPIFEEVKRLRDEGLGFDSIRRVIGSPSSPEWREPAAPTSRPGLVTRFGGDAAAPFEEPPRPISHLSDGTPPATFAAAVESQERLAIQLARLAHTNGQLQTHVNYLGEEVPRLRGQLETAQAENRRLRARLADITAHKDGLEQDHLVASQKLVAAEQRAAELEGEQLVLRARIDDLARRIPAPAPRPPQPQQAHPNQRPPFAPPNEAAAAQQVLELQKALIKSKERIAALEADEYERSEVQRPWWNFWD